MTTDHELHATLRPMGMDDLAHISTWFWNMDDVAMFDRTTPLPTNKDALHESWRAALSHTDPPKALWFVAETVDGKPLGIGGLQSINYIHGDAVLPMFISAAARGKGLATAITCRVMELAFNRLRLHRVTTFYREDNAVTERVLAKLGFVDEGRQREGWFVGGTRLDIVQSGILASDWYERREAALAGLGAAGKVRLAFTGENSV
ncbi:MAG: GNAT family N-acetyltransferase [Paracoccaceae bacterium]